MNHDVLSCGFQDSSSIIVRAPFLPESYLYLIGNIEQENDTPSPKRWQNGGQSGPVYQLYRQAQ